MTNTGSKQNTVVWDDIDWRKVEKYCFKLQKNIYAASRRGEIKKVRRLQKTLMRSWSNKVLAVRKVTQDNRGRKTAGVDGKTCLSPEARMKLVGQLKLTGKSKPTRRIWIPKPGKTEKRPLGIPTIYDRALQTVVKNILEPEWEAKFEKNSYGFRPGRSCHDAIKQIKNAIQQKPKFVLDADIAKCFDRIDHDALLQKLNHTGQIRQQIKAWLKSGAIDREVFTATSKGTPQGGTLSPLLANIALHGIENVLTEFAKTLDIRNAKGHQIGWTTKVQSLTFIRYADDFLLMHEKLSVVQRCRELISEWLQGMGLELKPSKTRITHTLTPELSEDKEAGFDFLGHHIQQFSCGKFRSAKDSRKKKKLGFRTLITPSKESCQRHQRNIKDVIRKHKYSHQSKLINELNPIIRGWINYYSNSDAQTMGIFAKQDFLTYQKLRAWGRHRCGSTGKAFSKYWTKIGNRITFATRQGDSNPLWLLSHKEIGSSSTKYVKVKGDKSPFDGNLVYWSIRMGRNPIMPSRKATLLKAQKGICPQCKLKFREEDILEEDHILALCIGGKDEYKNLQLLHGHCHDEKTISDMKEYWKQNITKGFEKINKILGQYNWFWDENDILNLGSSMTG